METEFLSQPDTRVGDMIDGVIAKRGTPLEFVVVSAFASLPTVLRLKPKIAEIRAAKCDARLVLGVDLGGTSKEVLQEVASWGVSVIVVKNRMFGVTFHPKIYLLRWKDHAEIIVGSNNLTDGGLYRNYEASSRTAYSLPTDQAAFDKAQKELKRFLKPAGPVATALASLRRIETYTGRRPPVDLTSLTPPQLLLLHSELADELRTRGITRSSNNPTGDLAEYLFCKAFDWKQADNSQANIDAVGPDGTRYQIKGRRITRFNKSRQLSAIRDMAGSHFDYLAGVLFSEDYIVGRHRAS